MPSPHARSRGSLLTSRQYDLKNRRTFLKRCDYPSVTLKDLYKGGVITVYSRQLTIVEYGDGFTAGKLEKARTLQILAGWPCVADASVPISSARHAALRRLCRDAAVGLLPATCCLLPASCCL